MSDETSPAPKKRSRRRMIWAGSLLVMLALVAAGVWGWFRYRVWPEETRRLLEMKNLAIGYLENEQLAKCSPLFEQLAEELPQEPLPARNLLLARLLAFKATGAAIDPEGFAQAQNQVQEALERVKSLEGETAIVHSLAARIAEHAQDEDAQWNHYLKAAELEPDNPIAWTAIFLTSKTSQDPERKRQATDAIKKAFALRPNNLYLLLELMLEQVQLQDRGLSDTLARAQELMRPFAESIQRLNGFDVLEALETASAQLRGENGNAPNWGLIRRQVFVVNNVVRKETATQRDLRRLEQHELEFLIQDFSPAFYDSAYLPAQEKASTIPVDFAPMENSLDLEDQGEVRHAQFLDFDLDGSLEILVVRDDLVQVFKRTDEEPWQEIASVSVPAGMRGAIAADLDRDYEEAPAKAIPDQEKSWLDTDPDLCVFGDAGLLILKNNLDAATGKRTLEIVSQSDVFQEQTGIVAAAFADLDHDGDLDLVASGAQGISLWLNLDNKLGPEGFEEITSRSALPGNLKPSVILPVDWDRNVAIDCVLAGPMGPAGWLENMHHGRFRWQPFENEVQANAIALLDADANASWDLLAARESGLSLELTSTPAGSVVRFQESRAIDDLPTSGVKALDYDNDGLMDFVAFNDEGVNLFHGLGDGNFERGQPFPDLPAPADGVDVGDIESDGDLDVLLFHEAGISLFKNEGGNANHWVDVFLRAEEDPARLAERCPMQGQGSLLELKAGTRYQPLVVTGPVTHFGLGTLERADVVRVLWTNGIPANIIQPSKNALVHEQQVLKGSCPYLYTWDGERFVFVTDLLWNAPIGLQFAEYVLAPSREWEYLRIAPEQLQPRNGEYHLQITEELWEAGYFDLVELIAVDHPEDLEIHTNEKVGPPDLGKHRLHALGNPRTPVAARDQNGRDVLAKIATRDDDYLKAYDQRIKQGLVPEHFLELDLGKLADVKTITLFLTGWMHPTDTSLNVGLGHNPLVDGPRPPYVLIPDEMGQWKEAIAFMGFPGGKTKTIVVEIPASKFSGKDYRLRIATSMQITWDEVVFTVDEPVPHYPEQPLKLLSAELHYRGFSERILHPKNGPDRYNYQKVSTEPRWPPMMGYFTRYGDVTELVETEDDRLVVMGAGDEMTLRFQAPPPPPKGFKRTFVLHNIGWDKDADLNTILGQAAEPLPFRAMKQYPYEPHQSAPDTPEYREFLKRYQTRMQSDAAFWKRLASPDSP